MARRRHLFVRTRAESVRRRLLPHRRTLRVEPLEPRLCLSAAQLVGHWTFDDAAVVGNTIVDTAPAPFQYNGTKFNGGPTTGVAGVLGEAASFAGGVNNSNSHFVNLSAHAPFSFGTLLATGTISAWVKPTRLGVGQPTDVFTIFSISNSNVGTGEMRFFVNNSSGAAGKLSYGVRESAEGANGHIHSVSNNLFDGQWHHVAVTVGAGHEARIYIDGNLEGSATRSFMTGLNANASAMGRNKDNTVGGGQWFFRGGMDDVGLWNNALTPAEVKALVSLAQHVQLNYNLGQAEQLFNLSDAGSGTVEVGGRTWEAASGLTSAEGEVVVDATGTFSLNLEGGIGVRTAVSPFVVTSTADAGDGTLREMIGQANSTAGADTITFDASVDGGTVWMNTGQMLITGALTIDATSLAGGFTIDAGLQSLQSRIFDIDDGGANDFDVTIAGLTITGGQTTGDNQTTLDHTFNGGAIRSLSTGDLRIEQTSITDSHVTGNLTSGGGIFSLGDVTLTGSTVSGNSAGSVGGGIRASGSVTLTQSTVSGNSAVSNGGGIRANDHVTLTQSTVSGNSSEGRGGGIFADNTATLTQSTVSGNYSLAESGGGIYAYGEVTVIDSTISGNSAELRGGGIYAFDDVTLTQSTISGNSAGNAGGGVFAYADVTLTQSTASANFAGDFGGGIVVPFDMVTLNSSIVAGNTAGTATPDLFTMSNASADYSLIGDNDGMGLSEAQDPDANGNLIGQSVANGGSGIIDPMLGLLADNGGLTQTHALLASSPAIDAGDPAIISPPDFDQRGAPFVRVFDGDGDSLATIDMGAFETQILTLVVDSTNDESDGDFSAGNLSLREAIELTNANPSADTITFAAGLSGQTIPLTLGQMTIAAGLTIDATSLAAPLRIDAEENSRIFDINGPGNNFDVTIAGLTLTRGQMTGDNQTGLDHTYSGGAIRSLSTGDLTIDQTRITESHISGLRTYGGGIFSRGNVTLTNSTVSGNSAAFSGGGIYTQRNATLSDSTVSGNSAGFSGGGIYSEGVTLTQSTVSGNSADFGGGIYAAGVTLTDSTVSGNSADRGGGIYAFDVTLTQSTISGNSAGNTGGGILAFADVNLTQSTISGNSAGNTGGGIFAYADVTLTQTTVSANFAEDFGGGISVPFDVVTLSGSIVAGNTAGSAAPDLFTMTNASVEFSLIGDNDGTGLSEAQVPDANGNLIGQSVANDGSGIIDPLLRLLADNRGPTRTHALLPGSPAIDAGDPAIAFDLNEFDQRGAPFVRVFDGDGVGGARIDIGALEWQFVTLVVDSKDDEIDGDFSAGNFSLREAIEQANSNLLPHVISFAASLSDETIPLTPALGQITIADELTIDATSLGAPLTIDAQEQSRIFDITGGASNVTIKGLTLTGGQITGNNSSSTDFNFSGGAIRSFASGTLAIENSTITDNHVSGNNTGGGGIFVLNDLTLIDSTISGNSAQSFGGGIRSRGDVTVIRSRISGNSAHNGEGGGIRTSQDLLIIESTLSGNSAVFFGGGGAASGEATVIQTTISGNTVTSRGGGLAAPIVTLRYSTVTGNSAFDTGGVLGTAETRLYGSIVAGNTATFLSPDVNNIVIAEHSLIGNDHGTIITDNGGNIIGTSEEPIDPLLDPLADNGGPTLTHALQPGSPAIDAGDPAAMAGVSDVPEFDQRGAGFPRVVNDRIDMGAYEVQIVPPALPGDYNQNNVVDAADYVLWRKTLGQTGVPPFSGADGDRDGEITEADYEVWRANFGNSLPPPGAGSGAAATAAIDEAIALDEQAQSQEHTAQNTVAFDEALNLASSDIALLFDSAATSASRVAKFRLPIVERLVRFDAAQVDLLLAVSPADRAARNEPIGPLHKAPEGNLAGDHDADAFVASDAWFAALEGSL